MLKKMVIFIGGDHPSRMLDEMFAEAMCHAQDDDLIGTFKYRAIIKLIVKRIVHET